ncbi:MAG: hypothetical protein DDT18_01161 [Actinobacteria bacterium]|nr:hypothetical protein [Actinomycetota bacterium]
MVSKTKRRAISRKAIQWHHISYEPEIKVKIFQKEHYWITVAERFNPISEGFIKCLREYIKKNKNRAVKL